MTNIFPSMPSTVTTVVQMAKGIAWESGSKSSSELSFVETILNPWIGGKLLIAIDIVYSKLQCMSTK